METKKKSYLLELPEAFMLLLEQNAKEEGLTKAAYIRTVILKDMLSKNISTHADKSATNKVDSQSA
jgi:hypothetical protein